MHPLELFDRFRRWFGWAPLPEQVDLPRYEEIQQGWNQRDCPDGLMSRLWRWVRGQLP